MPQRHDGSHHIARAEGIVSGGGRHSRDAGHNQQCQHEQTRHAQCGARTLLPPDEPGTNHQVQTIPRSASLHQIHQDSPDKLNEYHT